MRIAIPFWEAVCVLDFEHILVASRNLRLVEASLSWLSSIALPGVAVTLDCRGNQDGQKK